MQINVEDLLNELLRFDRKTTDKVKVDKMTRVVARTINLMAAKALTIDVVRSLMDMEPGGHA